MSTTTRRFMSSTVDPTLGCRETSLDDTIESSFPASDPPSSIPDPSYGTPAAEAEGAVAQAARRVVQAFEDGTAALPSHPLLWAAFGVIGTLLAVGVYSRLNQPARIDRRW